MKSSLYCLFALFVVVTNHRCSGFVVNDLKRSQPAKIPSATTTLKIHNIGQEDTVPNIDILGASGEAVADDTLEVKPAYSSPGDLALLAGLACVVAAATLSWVATDGPLVQHMEDDGSSATLLVDGVFGMVATIVSLVSPRSD